MLKNKLTDRQKKVLEIIINNIKHKGVAPSIREIQKLTNIKSTRGVLLQFDALEEAGFIKRNQKHRGIKVKPSLLATGSDNVSVQLIENTIEGEKDVEETVSVPLMTNAISAGVPAYVVQHSDTTISVPMLETGGMRNIFAVKVSGDSMVDENIEDGDFAIISPQILAEDGDIVAAHLEEQDGITLKKFRMIERRPVLFPANPKYKPITDRFEIQGKLISVIKKEEYEELSKNNT